MANAHSPTLDEAAAAHGRRLTDQLLALMEARGLSRSELARRLDTSPAYVTKILRGDANFTLASLVKLAAALEAELAIELRSGASAGAVQPARTAHSAATPEVNAPPAAPSRPQRSPRPAEKDRRAPAPRSGAGPDGDWRVW